MTMWRRGLAGGVIAVMGVLAGAAPAGAVGSPVRFLATFDGCGGEQCAAHVRDDSGHGHDATVQAEPGGGLRAEDGVEGPGVRLTRANLRVAGDADVDPDARAFAFGLFVKADSPLTEGENLFQRGSYSDEAGHDQFKLQMDAGRQGCVIKGDHARVFDFAPADLPVDGRWHSLVCLVTPATISYVVDGTPYSTANTAGPVTFPSTENVQIGGNFADGRNGDPLVHPIDDAFYAMGPGTEDLTTVPRTVRR